MKNKAALILILLLLNNVTYAWELEISENKDDERLFGLVASSNTPYFVINRYIGSGTLSPTTAEARIIKLNPFDGKIAKEYSLGLGDDVQMVDNSNGLFIIKTSRQIFYAFDNNLNLIWKTPAYYNPNGLKNSLYSGFKIIGDKIFSLIYIRNRIQLTALNLHSGQVEFELEADRTPIDLRYNTDNVGNLVLAGYISGLNSVYHIIRINTISGKVVWENAYQDQIAGVRCAGFSVHNGKKVIVALFQNKPKSVFDFEKGTLLDVSGFNGAMSCGSEYVNERQYKRSTRCGPWNACTLRMERDTIPGNHYGGSSKVIIERQKQQG